MRLARQGRRTAPRRRGVTLIEALVFGLLAMALVALGWGVLRTLLLRGRFTDGHLSGTQACLLASARLEDDLAALYEDPEHPLDAVAGPEGVVLSFTRRLTAPPRDEFGAPPLAAVVYRLDAAGRLTRQLEDDAPAALPGTFTALEVGVRQPTPAQGAQGAPWTITYRVASVPAEWTGGSDAESLAGREVSLAGAVARRDAIRAVSLAWWQRSPI